MADHILHIKADTFTANIVLAGLPDLPMPNIRKLFKLTLSHDWENREAIDAMGPLLEDAIRDSKAVWFRAKADYASGYQIIPRRSHRTKEQVQADARTREHNEELDRAVKCTKARYECWVKIQTLWNDTKLKMNIK